MTSPYSSPSELSSPFHAPGGRSFLPPLLILPIIVLLPLVLALVLAGGVYLLAASQATHTVYLVNGLDEPYTVSVDGEEIELAPRNPRKVEGLDAEVEVEVLEESLDIPRRVFDVSAGLGMLASQVVVINPDRLAVLEWEEVVYTHDPTSTNTGSFQYKLNEDIYRFENIRYLFEKSPDTAETPPFSMEAVHTRLGLSEEPPETAVLYAGGPEQTLSYVRRVLEHLPEEEGARVLESSAYMIEAEEYFDLIRPRLDRTPVDVPLHETYQGFMKDSFPVHDLKAEYQDLLDRNPESGDLHYLLARLIDDYKESNSLLVKSVKGESPSYHGAMEIARRLLVRGQFDEAYRYARPAMKALGEENERYHLLWEDILLSQGRVGEYITRVEESLDAEAWTYEERASNVIVLLARQNRLEEARDLARKVESILRSSYSPEYAEYYGGYMEALMSYGQGEWLAYLRKMEDLDGSGEDYEFLMQTGDLREAWDMMEYWGDGWGVDYLLLYALATSAGQSVVAKDGLRVGLENLDWEGGPSAKAAAEIFRRGKAPSQEEILALDLLPQDKRVVVTALGLYYPEARDDAFALARRLNYSPLHPHVLIERIVGNSDTGGGGESP